MVVVEKGYHANGREKAGFQPFSFSLSLSSFFQPPNIRHHSARNDADEINSDRRLSRGPRMFLSLRYLEDANTRKVLQ